MKMKISVIIPVYNVKGYIGSCLDSIVVAANRAKHPVECICVDDGSTDGSGAIVDAYAQDHTSPACDLRVVHKVNGGEGSARNAGIEVATGDWLMYCDADDLVGENYFADVERALACYPDVDLVRSETAAFQDGDSPIWGGDGALRLVDLRRLLPSEIAMFGVTEMAYRRSVFGAFRFTDHKIGADIVYTNRCFCKASGVAVVLRKNYGYRVRGDSAAHSSRTPRKIIDGIDLLRLMALSYRDCGRQVARSLCRGCGSAWIEQCGAEIVSHAGEPEWLDVKRKWFESLKEARTIPLFTRWQRMAAGVISSTRSIRVAWFLCVVPLALKKKGVHR